MKFENIRVYNFEHALRGMRNPKNSWHLSDSSFGLGSNEQCLIARDTVAEKWFEKMPIERDGEEGQVIQENILQTLMFNGIINVGDGCAEWAFIGPEDMRLAQQLIKGGSEHRKFLRQIMVTVDITAPLYIWKEFDTYKVGTTANSTSTMHKLTSKPITIDCFETDDFVNIPYPIEAQRTEIKSNCDTDFVQMCLIPYLEHLRQEYLRLMALYKEHPELGYDQEAKIVWKELIRWLPESWLQTRTVTLNYENIFAMKHQRKNHKLTEWSKNNDDYSVIDSFIKFTNVLPYSEDFLTIS